MHQEHVREHTTVQQDQLVMPFYVAADVSWSMTDDMGALNQGLRALQSAIAKETVVDDVARLGVLTFSDRAEVVVPLGQVSEETRLPTLSVQGGTNYGALFELLAATIDRDRKALKAQGHKIFRPCVFFLTDGEPLDHDWAASFKRSLTYDKATGAGMPAHPIFIPFGFRDAPESVMRQLAYPPERGRWFMAKQSSVSDALEGVINIIMGTVIETSMTVNPGVAAKPMLQLPAPAAGSGITSGASDYDDDYIN